MCVCVQEGTLHVLDSLPFDARAVPAARRLARSMQALLGLSSQMQDGMGAQRSNEHKQAVALAISRLGATSAASRRG